MTNFDDGVGRLRSAASHLLAAANTAAAAAGSIAAPITGPWGRFTLWLKAILPKGLYARALLIIIVPDGRAAIRCRVHVRRAAMERGQLLPGLRGDA